MTRRTLAGVLCAALTLTTLAFSPAAWAIDADAYGESMTVTFGTNEHSAVPVSVDLPVPGEGLSISQISITYRRALPTYATFDTAIFTVQTPQCVATEPCHVDAVVPTGRMSTMNMIGPGVGVRAFSGDTLVGLTSRTFVVANPKPSVLAVEPGVETQWGTSTLSAQATPSSAGTPIKGVRFYLNPTGAESNAYLFDDTAPYSVQVPSLDIAAAGRTGLVFAVAEDVEGNLSPYNVDGHMSRSVRVGPPPVLTWKLPKRDGAPIGDVSNWYAQLGYVAEIDPMIPAVGAPADPYISRIEILIDGQPFADMAEGSYPVWSGFVGHRRKIEFVHELPPASIGGAGHHIATLRVTTSYGSVGQTEIGYVITNGAVFSDITTTQAMVVEDGSVATVGVPMPLRFTASGLIEGSAVYEATIVGPDGQTIAATTCSQPATWEDCPEQLSVNANWTPDESGTFTLSFTAWLAMANPQTITRRIEVRPAPPQAQIRPTLSIAVNKKRIKSGNRVKVTGHVTDTVTNKAVSGLWTRLWWRKRGETQWRFMRDVVSDSAGNLHMKTIRRSTGVFRWVTEGDPFHARAAVSRSIKVKVKSPR